MSRTASARWAVALGIALALTACGGPDVRPMTLSPGESSRRRYAERTEYDRERSESDALREEERALAGGEASGTSAGVTVPEIAPRPPAVAPSPPAPPDPSEGGGYAYELAPDSTGAGGTGGDDYRTSLDAEDSVAESPSAPPGDDVDVHSRSVETLATVTGSTASVAPRILNIGAFTTVEPLPWVPLDPAPLPAGPRRVLLASLELPPGLAVFPPSSSCQDVLLYLSAGTLEATGTGIGTLDAPATLYPGDAVRFGPEGDARVENTGSEVVRAILAIARREGTGVPLYTAIEEADRCPGVPAPDPLVRPMRMGTRATASPLVVLDGHLEVRILLDADGSGAMHAGLAVLSGDAQTRVAPHVHDASAELLFIEDGEGTMHIGDHTLDIHPGVVVYVPEGVMHSFEPTGSRPLVALQVYAPSGPEQRFRGLAATR